VERATAKAKLSREGREVKRVSRTTRGEPTIAIPLVVEPVVVELALRTVPIEDEHVAIAVRVTPSAPIALHTTTRRMFSGLNLIRHRNALATGAKYLQFFEVST
jgi:hypothetical protein